MLFLRKGIVWYCSTISFLLLIPLILHVFHWVNFGVAPTEYSYISVLQTNRSEALEFAQSYLDFTFFLWVILMVIIPIFLLLWIKKIESESSCSTIPKLVISILLVFMNFYDDNESQSLATTQYLRFKSTDKALKKIIYWNELVSKRKLKNLDVKNNKSESSTFVVAHRRIFKFNTHAALWLPKRNQP